MQARPPHQRCATAAFYSAKSRQGLGLGGLARRGGPDVQGYTTYVQGYLQCSSEIILPYKITCVVVKKNKVTHSRAIGSDGKRLDLTFPIGL